MERVVYAVVGVIIRPQSVVKCQLQDTYICHVWGVIFWHKSERGTVITVMDVQIVILLISGSDHE